MSAKNWFRQLGNKTKPSGRQLGRDTAQLGRQAHTALKLLPQTCKDVSKVYSDLEKRTANLPTVPDVFHGASLATQATGGGLSGNFQKALSGGEAAYKSGGGTLGQATDAASKHALVFA